MKSKYYYKYNDKTFPLIDVNDGYTAVSYCWCYCPESDFCSEQISFCRDSVAEAAFSDVAYATIVKDGIEGYPVRLNSVNATTYNVTTYLNTELISKVKSAETLFDIVNYNTVCCYLHMYCCYGSLLSWLMGYSIYFGQDYVEPMFVKNFETESSYYVCNFGNSNHWMPVMTDINIQCLPETLNQVTWCDIMPTVNAGFFADVMACSMGLHFSHQYATYNMTIIGCIEEGTCYCNVVLGSAYPYMTCEKCFTTFPTSTKNNPNMMEIDATAICAVDISYDYCFSERWDIAACDLLPQECYDETQLFGTFYFIDFYDEQCCPIKIYNGITDGIAIVVGYSCFTYTFFECTHYTNVYDELGRNYALCYEFVPIKQMEYNCNWRSCYIACPAGHHKTFDISGYIPDASKVKYWSVRREFRATAGRYLIPMLNYHSITNELPRSSAVVSVFGNGVPKNGFGIDDIANLQFITDPYEKFIDLLDKLGLRIIPGAITCPSSYFMMFEGTHIDNFDSKFITSEVTNFGEPINPYIHYTYDTALGTCDVYTGPCGTTNQLTMCCDVVICDFYVPTYTTYWGKQYYQYDCCIPNYGCMLTNYGSASYKTYNFDCAASYRCLCQITEATEYIGCNPVTCGDWSEPILFVCDRSCLVGCYTSCKQGTNFYVCDCCQLRACPLTLVLLDQSIYAECTAVEFGPLRCTECLNTLSFTPLHGQCWTSYIFDFDLPGTVQWMTGCQAFSNPYYRTMLNRCARPITKKLSYCGMFETPDQMFVQTDYNNYIYDITEWPGGLVSYDNHEWYVACVSSNNRNWTIQLQLNQ